MNFWTKYFYLLYFFNYMTNGSSEIQFNVMALGHSGLHISWDPTATAEDGDFLEFNFEYNETGNVKTNYSGVAPFTDGKYKIHSLNEGTHYNITIQERQSRKKYTIGGKTSMKRNIAPEKPNFTWDIIKHHQSYTDFTPPKYGVDNAEGELAIVIRIEWIPCSEQKNCHGHEAGTHFAVKYKILDSRSISTIEQHSNLHQDILYTFAGKIYEIVVTSINGDFETDSDPQEILHKPFSGPVHSVRILPLTNTSVYISWKKPRQSTEKEIRYIVTLKKFDNINALQWNGDYQRRNNYKPPVEYFAFSRLEGDLYQEIFTGLTPNNVYTFFIIPYGEENYGFEFRTSYFFQAIQANLTLGKPDFRIQRMKTDVLKMGHCNDPYAVYWLPCMEKYDCKNMNPGSGFEVKIENGNDTATHYSDPGSDSIHEMFLKVNVNYRFIGKSVNEFNQTSVEIIKELSCEGVKDIN